MIGKAIDLIDDVVAGAKGFASEHPLWTMAIFVALFLGGCSLAVHVRIVSSSTRLMPY